MRLTADVWRARAAAHAARADAFTADHRARRSRHEAHPVEDFLYEYYPLKAGRMRRWHPGVGVELLPDGAAPVGRTAPPRTEAPPGSVAPPGAVARPGGGPRPDEPLPAAPEDLAARASWRWHEATDRGGVRLDVGAFLADRGEGVRWVHELLRRTADRRPTFSCFGWHEWAMVYRQADHRHPLPLRLGQAATDRAVEGATIRCSHVDAYRFFTPEAAGRNTLRPTRTTQLEMDQPGCLHVTMDLLRWCLTLGPAVPGELLMDCADLTLRVRRLDMAASPYDVSGLGLTAVPIEEPAGRAEYARRQREQSEAAAPLRARLLEVTTALIAGAPA